MRPSTISGAIVADSACHPNEHVAVVADRRLSVAALSALLVAEPRYRLLQEIRGMNALTAALRHFLPTVALVDAMWNGWPIPLDRGEWGGRTMLMLDPADEPQVFVRAARTGIHGYLSRSATRHALVMAVETLRITGYYLDPLLAKPIVSALREIGRAPLTQRSALSQHEQDILVAVARGRSSKEIAREYAITPKTVANHVANMYQKLNLKHRGELVLYAAREGLTSSESPDDGTTIPFNIAAAVR